MSTKNILFQHFSIELLRFRIKSRETLFAVRDEDTAIRGTLHGSEDTSTSGGTGETDIKESLEGSALLAINLGGLGQSVLSIGLLDTGEGLVNAELLEDTAGNEKTSGISGGPVGQTVLDTVSLQLMGVSGSEDLVTRDLRGDDLDDDVAVGEADDKSVLGSIVLVLGLGDQSLAGIVIGLSGPSALVLGLEAAERGEGEKMLASNVQCDVQCDVKYDEKKEGKGRKREKKDGSFRGHFHSPVVSAALDQLVERLS